MAVLFTKVLLVIVTGPPWAKIAPPFPPRARLPAVLFTKVQSSIATEPVERMAPPPKNSNPLASVKSLRVSEPPKARKIGLLPPASIVMPPAGPSTLKVLLVSVSPPAVAIVPVTENSIVSLPLPALQPLTAVAVLAATTASCSVHAGAGTLPPLVELTTIMLARAKPDIASRKSGSTTVASLKRRFEIAMNPSPAQPAALANFNNKLIQMPKSKLALREVTVNLKEWIRSPNQRRKQRGRDVINIAPPWKQLSDQVVLIAAFDASPRVSSYGPAQ